MTEQLVTDYPKQSVFFTHGSNHDRMRKCPMCRQVVDDAQDEAILEELTRMFEELL